MSALLILLALLGLIMFLAFSASLVASGVFS